MHVLFGQIENISHMTRLSHFVHLYIYSSLFQVKCNVCFLLLWTYLPTITLSKSQLPIKDAIWFAFSSWPPLGSKFFFFIFWLLSWLAFLAKELWRRIQRLNTDTDNVLCSAEISRPGPLRSLARSPVLSPSVLFSSVKIGIKLRIWGKKKPRNATDFKPKSCSLYDFDLHVFGHDPQQG